MDPEIDPIEPEEVIDEVLDAPIDGESVIDPVDGEPTDPPIGDDQIVITLGDEEPAEDVEESEAATAPEWVRDLRKDKKALVRAVREKDAEIARLKGGTNTSAAPSAVVVGEKPTFETCEFDPEKFEVELTAWRQRKDDAEAQQRARTESDQAAQKHWRERLASVDAAATKFAVRDPDGASLAFESTFSVIQQAIIVDGPEDPKEAAALRIALSTHPKSAQKLAAISNPIRMAFAAAAFLHKEVKMTTRKPAPIPEKRISGNVAGAAAVDNQLNRLRAEAEKSGNYTKVTAYKNEQKKKAARAA